MNVDELEFEGLTLPRFAEVSARLDRAGEDGRRMVLALVGLSPDQWERARVEYEARVADPAEGPRVEAAFRAHYEAAVARMEGRNADASAHPAHEEPGNAAVGGAEAADPLPRAAKAPSAAPGAPGAAEGAFAARGNGSAASAPPTAAFPGSSWAGCAEASAFRPSMRATAAS